MLPGRSVGSVLSMQLSRVELAKDCRDVLLAARGLVREKVGASSV